MTNSNATKEILKALQQRERITQIDAFRRWGVTRLASIVHNLRKAGHDVQTNMIENGRTKYAEYFLS